MNALLVGRMGAPILAVLCSQVPTAAPAAQTDGHPHYLVDEGACPGECCTYREWKVERDVPLYAEPKLEAVVVGKLRRGNSIEPLAGKVITSAGQFRVTQDTREYHRGETVWVYTYHGEGNFKVWYRGAMREEDLGFSPYGGTAGDRCQVPGANCWGSLEEPLKMTWWAKLRTPSGVEGWSIIDESFSGTDACG